MQRIWRETLGRIEELEKQVKNINDFIIPGVNDKSEPEKPDQGPGPDQKPGPD